MPRFQLRSAATTSQSCPENKHTSAAKLHALDHRAGTLHTQHAREAAQPGEHGQPQCDAGRLVQVSSLPPDLARLRAPNADAPGQTPLHCPPSETAAAAPLLSTASCSPPPPPSFTPSSAPAARPLLDAHAQVGTQPAAHSQKRQTESSSAHLLVDVTLQDLELQELKHIARPAVCPCTHDGTRHDAHTRGAARAHARRGSASVALVSAYQPLV